MGAAVGYAVRFNDRSSAHTLLRVITDGLLLAEIARDRLLGRYDTVEALAAFLAERHSYDEPEIVATQFVAGSPSFLGWITDETRLRDSDVPRPRDAEESGAPDLAR